MITKGTVCELKEDSCGTVAGTKVIVQEDDAVYPDFSDLNGNGLGSVSVDNLTPLTGLDALKKGDVVVNRDGLRRTCLGVCGDVYLMSYADSPECYCLGYTLHELRSGGYAIVGQTQIIKEVFDANGKRLGVLVDGKVIKED